MTNIVFSEKIKVGKKVITMASQSVTGLPRNTAAALAVVLAPTVVGTLVLLFLEKDPFVRFYAVQVLLTGFVIVVLQWFLVFSVILSSLAGLLTILGFVLWLIMVYRAWQGDEWEVPVLGNLTKQLMKRLHI